MKSSPLLLVALAGSVIASDPAAPANVQRNAAPAVTPPPPVRPRDPANLGDIFGGAWESLMSQASDLHTSVFGPVPTQIPPQFTQIPPEWTQIPPEWTQIPPQLTQIPPLFSEGASIASSLLSEASAIASSIENVARTHSGPVMYTDPAAATRISNMKSAASAAANPTRTRAPTVPDTSAAGSDYTVPIMGVVAAAFLAAVGLL